MQLSIMYYIIYARRKSVSYRVIISLFIDCLIFVEVKGFNIHYNVLIFLSICFINEDMFIIEGHTDITIQTLKTNTECILFAFNFINGNIIQNYTKA